jgi:hypothetical protein
MRRGYSLSLAAIVLQRSPLESRIDTRFMWASDDAFSQDPGNRPQAGRRPAWAGSPIDMEQGLPIGAVASENAKLHEALKDRLETLKTDADGWYRFLAPSGSWLPEPWQNLNRL